ncbi:MAG: D-alanyl-D-alanine carboxypeptidase [Caulobacteraceae bacterium]|nr:D-alanyl-D-alanine carboxypeptidase [Caulobacteraceae bacterium]
MDARTNEVLLEDQADEARFPASLTKMMTLYMLFESIERGDMTLDTRLTASRNAARQPPSRLGLACSRRRGCDSITVDQAIRALAVQSANDVAVMVAERLGGTESRFSANMTARARELGMSNTRFANASGLPDTATAPRLVTWRRSRWLCGAIFRSIITISRRRALLGAGQAAATTTACSAASMALTASRLVTPAPQASTSRR